MWSGIGGRISVYAIMHHPQISSMIATYEGLDQIIEPQDIDISAKKSNFINSL